ncbi:MAG: hypothetical protein AAGF01_12935 [Cyanobacteria bacterium P01_G01_bin.38]
MSLIEPNQQFAELALPAQKQAEPGSHPGLAQYLLGCGEAVALLRAMDCLSLKNLKDLESQPQRNSQLSDSLPVFEWPLSME